MDRMAMFRLWLSRMTPEKVELIVRLEKIARMIAHLNELSGTWDEKLLADLVKTSREIRESYSERYEQSAGKIDDKANVRTGSSATAKASEGAKETA